MTECNYEIQSINIRKASQEDYVAMNRINNVIRAEVHPDDPPMPLEEYCLHMQNVPEYVDVKYWIIWNKDKQEIIASGNVEFQRTEENQHLADFNIRVLPDFRRQGFGRKLLQRIAQAAKEENRRCLVTETESRIPGGDEFMKAIGGKKVLESHTNQLKIEDIDPELIKKWLLIARERSEDFILGFWPGEYPEDKIHEVAKLYDLENQQPHDDLEHEDSHVTPEQLRQSEQHLFARGDQRWTYYLVEKQTGKFVGYTETIWNPNRPEVLWQDMTGVFPELSREKAWTLVKGCNDRSGVKRTTSGETSAYRKC